MSGYIGKSQSGILANPSNNTVETSDIQDDAVTPAKLSTGAPEWTSGYDFSLKEDTGTTAKFFWDASAESLGIGTSSPSTSLQVTNNSVGDLVKITGANSTDLRIGNHALVNGGFYLDSVGTGKDLRFRTQSTDRMSIDSSGNVLIGTTTVTSIGKLQLTSDSNNYYGFVDRAQVSTGGAPAGFFNYAGSEVGSIYTTSSSTNYNTSSDYRLKTDVQPMTGATERLKALKPVNFEWISTGERVDGFLAHEAQEVVPEAVTGTKDAMRTEEYEVTPAVLDDDGNVVTEAVMGEREVPDYQGIDQSKLVPLLVATIQELEARIAALESV